MCSLILELWFKDSEAGERTVEDALRNLRACDT